MRPFRPAPLPRADIDPGPPMPLLGRASRAVARCDGIVRALAGAVAEPRDRPWSLETIRRAHEVRLAEPRGSDHRPGSCRERRVRNGPAASTGSFAVHLAPSPRDLPAPMGSSEQYPNHQRKIGLPCVSSIQGHFDGESIVPNGARWLARILIDASFSLKGFISTPPSPVGAHLETHREGHDDVLGRLSPRGDGSGRAASFLRALEGSGSAAPLAGSPDRRPLSTRGGRMPRSRTAARTAPRVASRELLRAGEANARARGRRP